MSDRVENRKNVIVEALLLGDIHCVSSIGYMALKMGRPSAKSLL